MATVGTVALLAIVLSARFVFETLLVGRAAVGAAAVAALASALGLFVLKGFPRVAAARVAGLRATALALSGGALSFALAPFVVLTHRYSDAPAGTVTLFWTVAFLGALIVLVSWLLDRDRGLPSGPAGALIALTAAAAVLANWERPSSFSLLARHLSQQVWIGFGACLAAAGLLAVGIAAREQGSKVAVPLAAVGALIGGVILLLSDPMATWRVGASPEAIGFAALSGACAMLLVRAAVSGGLAAAGAGGLLAPSVLTLFTFVEAALGALGPRPVLLDQVAWATVAAAAGVFGALRVAAGPVGLRPTRIVPAGMAVVAAAGAMAMPGVSVAVRGMRTDTSGFEAAFTMSGFETVGGWLALSLAGFLLIESVSGGSADRARAIGTAAVVVSVAAAWFALRSVPLHVWVGWIPAEVQQDYGTEYASIRFTPTAVWLQAASVGLSVTSVALALVSALRGPGRVAAVEVASEKG